MWFLFVHSTMAMNITISFIKISLTFVWWVHLQTALVNLVVILTTGNGHAIRVTSRSSESMLTKMVTLQSILRTIFL
ncbi:Uncharacterised protein [Mycobacterium tuberculosis]|nr:Uncharacterised protein [Mycobacterium tuberculosis]